MELKKSPKSDLEKFKGIFLQIGLVTALVVLFFVFEWKTPNSSIIVDLPIQGAAIEEDLIFERPIEESIKPPIPKPIQSEIIEIVEDDKEIKEEMVLIDEVITETTEIEYVEVEEPEDECVDFYVVEKMPIFMPKKCKTQKEGNIELQKWIAKKVRYPNIARQNDIQGKVYIRFLVTDKGKIDKVSIVRGVDPLLDNEAIRVIKSLPDWKPGIQRTKKVNVWYTVPIAFRLD